MLPRLLVFTLQNLRLIFFKIVTLSSIIHLYIYIKMLAKYFIYIPSLILVFLLRFNIASAQTYPQNKIDSLTQLYDETKNFDDKKRLLKDLSNVYQNLGDWNKYDEIVKNMLLLQEEKVDSFYLAETYNKLGISNCIVGKNPEAIVYFSKALEINIAQKEDLTAANSYENLGIVYKDMGNYSKAVESQLKSLELRKGKKSERIFNNYIKLSIVLELLGDYDRMDYYIDLAKNEMTKMDSITPRTKAIFYNQLGDIYSKRKLYNSSIICFKNVIKYSEQIGWNLGIAAGFGSIAEVYHNEKLLDSSIYYHKKSLKLSQDISNSLSITEQSYHLAKLFNESGKKDSVMQYANNALQIAKQSNLLNEQSKILKFIAEFYSSNQNYKQAYPFLKEHYIANDSISSSDVKNNVAKLETIYETKLKEQNIELLTAENKLKNQELNIGIAVVIILLIIITFILYILNISKKQAKLKQNDLRGQVLRTQMNPHFIFNVLGSIQNFMMQNDTRKASKYLTKFATLIRGTLNNSTAETISLADEINMLKNYIELEKMRKQNKFDYSIDYSDNLEGDFIQIPPMLIQPFVENSIKHGFKSLKKGGVLNLKINDKKDWIEFIIEDNGEGFQEKATKQKGHKSMAMSIFERRRKLIQQKHHKDFKFEIVNLKDKDPKRTGVLISINIPILNND